MTIVLLVSGQIESSQTVNISTRIMGYITKLNVKVGDYVKAGQLLASINSTDIVAKRAQVDAMIGEADAAFQNAQKDLDRFTILNKQQSATAKELDNVTLQYNSVKAKLEAAKQMRNEINASLAYTQLTAPFAGIVTQKFAEVGSMANPGMPIVTIEQSGSLQISANIPETEIQHIHMNDATVVTVKSLNKTFQSKIVQINPSSQFTGGQYVVKMQIPDADKKQVYAGMYVNISIPLKGKKYKKQLQQIASPYLQQVL
jgi:RND family efflux transporter MFP subunit